MRMMTAEPVESPAKVLLAREGVLASRGVGGGATSARGACVCVTRILRQSSVKNGGGLILADEPTTVQSGYYLAAISARIDSICVESSAGSGAEPAAEAAAAWPSAEAT